MREQNAQKPMKPELVKNTPGTAGGLGGHDRKLAVKERKNVRKLAFFL